MGDARLETGPLAVPTGRRQRLLLTPLPNGRRLHTDDGDTTRLLRVSAPLPNTLGGSDTGAVSPHDENSTSPSTATAGGSVPLATMSMAQLKRECRKLGVPIRGSKAQLARRVQRHRLRCRRQARSQTKRSLPQQVPGEGTAGTGSKAQRQLIRTSTAMSAAALRYMPRVTDEERKAEQARAFVTAALHEFGDDEELRALMSHTSPNHADGETVPAGRHASANESDVEEGAAAVPPNEGTAEDTRSDAAAPSEHPHVLQLQNIIHRNRDKIRLLAIAKARVVKMKVRAACRVRVWCVECVGDWKSSATP